MFKWYNIECVRVRREIVELVKVGFKYIEEYKKVRRKFVRLV